MNKLLFIVFSFPMIGLTQELITENMIFDGNNRQYTAYIPETYSPSIPSPILMAFHGGAGYAQEFMNYEADFRSIADTAGFILVYPQALEDPNDDNNTSWLHKEPTNHNDIYFIDALIDSLSSDYSVDNDRVYISGYSLGGMFSYELACHLNDRVAAFSSVAGAAFIGAFYNCNMTHPTALLNIVGTNDDTHPYNDVNGWYYPVSEINSYWATVNNTDSAPLVIELPDLNISDGSQVEKYSWINGDGCVTVEEIKIINGGHDWPSPLSFWANQDINANTEIWNFVSKYNINGLIDCDNLSIGTENIDSKRELIKIINVLGQEVNVPYHRREVLFYIYNDGSVQKKINL